MIQLNLALIISLITIVGSLLGLIGSIIKFSNSINTFDHSINGLKQSMNESQNDRLDLRKNINEHSKTLIRIDTQYYNIQDDLKEIKKEIKRVV